jgi:hypothetical protein
MPYRFYSAKFNPAQVNYNTKNQELLAVVSAVKQFKQHLVGWKFVIVSDHEPLKTFWTTAPTLTRRHIRMYNELSRFDFEMEFIPGKDNVIADSLSRVWECDDLVASDSDFVHEPDLDSIPPSSASLSAFAARFTPPFSATSPVPSPLLPSSDWLTLHSISGDSLPDSPLDDPPEVPDLDDGSDHGDGERVEGVEE